MRKIAIILIIISLITTSGCSTSGFFQSKSKSTFNLEESDRLYDAGKFDEALKNVDEYLKEHPDDIIALSQKARVLVQKGEVKEGISLLHRLIKQKESLDSNLSNLSWAYYRDDSFELSLEYANRALEIQPNTSNEYQNKANALYEMHRYDEAIEQYTEVINLDENPAAGYFGISLCYYYKKDFGKAFTNARKAVELDSNESKYLSQAVESCVEMQAYNTMLDLCDDLLTKYPNLYHPYFYKGRALLFLERYDEAIDNFNLYMDHSDYDASSHYQKCLVYLKLNNKAEAFECFKKAHQEDPSFYQDIDMDVLKALKGYKEFDRLFNVIEN